MFLSGVQFRFRLDSRLKHAGMTDLGLLIYFTEQAAGNEPVEIQHAAFPRNALNGLNDLNLELLNS